MNGVAEQSPLMAGSTDRNPFPLSLNCDQRGDSTGPEWPLLSLPEAVVPVLEVKPPSTAMVTKIQHAFGAPGSQPRMSLHGHAPLSAGP